MPASTTAAGGPPSPLAGFGGAPPLPAQRPGDDEPPRRPRRLPVAAVLVATGLLLTVAVTSARRSAPERSRQRSAIGAMVDARTKEVAGLVAARQRLRQQIDAARVDAASMGASTRAAQATARRLTPGVGAVAGPGATVALNDPPSGLPAHRITDAEVAQVVNVLWAAGAEAIAVNNVRLTARSAIRSAGDAILVNFRPLSPPYRVQAIGSPDALTTGFADSAIAARLRTEAAVYDVSLSVSIADRLPLPAASEYPAPSASPKAFPTAGTGEQP